MTRIYLKKNEERRVLNGHRWVFSNEIHSIENSIETGEIAEICSQAGSLIGAGFYNKNSLIAVRMLSGLYEGDVSSYILEKLSRANVFRKSIYPHRNSYRMVFGESDDLPGLIVDKYNDTFVLQVSCAGMQKNIRHIINALKEHYAARNIFSCNDFYMRKLEGLPEEDEIYAGEMAYETMSDGKISYKIEFNNSQKTGFFFDQCDNREFVERLAAGKSVLDAFCNSGGFGMHCALAGADSITFVDASNAEIESARTNYELNKLNVRSEYIVSDVFRFLESCNSQNRKFDIVIVDPPAFAKSRKSIPTALKGYMKLNKLALGCVEKGGYLVSSSCSHHIDEKDFLNSIALAAGKISRSVRLFYRNGASMDHPQLPSMPETSYLKFMVFEVS